MASAWCLSRNWINNCKKYEVNISAENSLKFASKAYQIFWVRIKLRLWSYRNVLNWLCELDAVSLGASVESPGKVSFLLHAGQSWSNKDLLWLATGRTNISILLPFLYVFFPFLIFRDQIQSLTSLFTWRGGI